MRTRHAVFAAALVTLALGCEQSRPPASPASTDRAERAFNPPAPSPDDASVASAIRASRDDLRTPTDRSAAIAEPKPFYGTSTSPGGQILAKSDSPLTDAQILGVAFTANDVEVETAELAIRKARDPDLRQFAATMKSSHSAALQKARLTETRTKITSAESDVSSYLRSDAESVIKSLRDASGRAFDEAYLDGQVKAHNDVLLAIDNRLSASATNGEVKVLLGEMRRTVADHLAKAEELKKKMHEVADAPRTRPAPAAPGVAGPKDGMSRPPKWKHDVGPVDPQPRP